MHTVRGTKFIDTRPIELFENRVGENERGPIGKRATPSITDGSCTDSVVHTPDEFSGRPSDI